MKSPETKYQKFSKEDFVFPDPPKVSLISISQTPLETHKLSSAQITELNAATILAGQSARTCYSSQLITPADYLTGSEKHRTITDSVVISTKESGHLTTRQHLNFTFGIEGVSRYLTWSLLHSHPDYNSEQQSQRYVSMDDKGLMLPRLEDPHLDQAMQAAGRRLVEGYHELTDLLTPITTQLYLERFPGRSNQSWNNKVSSEAHKKAQEVARYLLPLGFKTTMYHTVNALTLSRYHRLKNTFHVNPEANLLVDSLINAAVNANPSFLNELDDPLPLEHTPEYQAFKELHQPLDTTDINNILAGRPAALDLDQQNLTQKLAQAVRLTLNLNLSDSEAVDLVLNPRKNPLLASKSGEVRMHQLSQTLNQIHLSAIVSLSHSADSQLQRHRALNHTQPLLDHLPQLDKDVVIPTIFYLLEAQHILEKYLEIQQQNIFTIHTLSEAGVDPSLTNYLLTNASRVKKRISGPLGGFYHFIKTRTCLNTQAEIYNIAIEIARQLPLLDQDLGQYFKNPAPCSIRKEAGIKPFCPEGNHYCGVPIWRHSSLSNYPSRNI